MRFLTMLAVAMSVSFAAGYANAGPKHPSSTTPEHTIIVPEPEQSEGESQRGIIT